MYVMTYKKGICAEFGPVNVFQFERDSVKSISCIRIKVIIIIKNYKKPIQGAPVLHAHSIDGAERKTSK